MLQYFKLPKLVLVLPTGFIDGILLEDIIVNMDHSKVSVDFSQYLE